MRSRQIFNMWNQQQKWFHFDFNIRTKADEKLLQKKKTEY